MKRDSRKKKLSQKSMKVHTLILFINVRIARQKLEATHLGVDRMIGAITETSFVLSVA